MSRYLKQSILPEIQAHGQKAIETSSVLCVGAGGLGSPVLMYLAAAGVGRIGIVDADVVEFSNLQRQVLFQESDVGSLKVVAAKQNLEKLNSNCMIEVFPVMLTASNVENIFSDFDIIIDGTDNFSAKYLINDAAVKLKKPLIFGAVTGFEGQVSIFDSSQGPCYRCLYPVAAESVVPNCAEGGVLGAVVGVIGSMQAAECLKLIVSQIQVGLQPLVGRLLTLDARDMSIFTAKITKNLECPTCSVAPEEINLVSSEESCSIAEILQNPGEYILIDVRERDEWDAGFIPGAIHFPLSVMKSSLKNFPKPDATKKMVTYCKSGLRSKEAIRILEKSGFLRVYHLSGGSADHFLG